MTSPKRYAVPMEHLDAVEVAAAEQVQEERAVAHPDASAWGGSLIPAHGGGGTNDADGE